MTEYIVNFSQQRHQESSTNIVGELFNSKRQTMPMSNRCRRNSDDVVRCTPLVVLLLVLMNGITTSNAFTVTSTPIMMGSALSSFTQQSRLCWRAPNSSQTTCRTTRNVQLRMMFDQLSAALTDVTKNFGKKR